MGPVLRYMQKIFHNDRRGKETRAKFYLHGRQRGHETGYQTDKEVRRGLRGWQADRVDERQSGQQQVPRHRRGRTTFSV